MNEKRILDALKAFIINDDTEQYLPSPSNGVMDENDDNLHWLKVLSEGQQAYFEATGEVVPNEKDVVLVPGHDPNF